VGTKAPLGAPEKAYRLFIEEMPDPNEGPAAGAQVAVKLRFGVPIFHWNGTPQAKLEAKAEAAPGEARLTVRNVGDRQLRFEEVLVTQGERLIAKAAGWYVFPGATRTFQVPVTKEACPIRGPVQVRAVGEGKDVGATLESATGLCPA
jgi:fimbrial chaperone protein